jgi:hypothetical protein
VCSLKNLLVTGDRFLPCDIFTGWIMRIELIDHNEGREDMEIKSYVLEAHAAAALGIHVWQLNLPRVGDGIDADALWTCPQFQEVIRRKQAIAAKAERHRHDLHPELQHKSHPHEHELDDKELLKVMKRRARERRRKAMRAAAASI